MKRRSILSGSVPCVLAAILAACQAAPQVGGPFQAPVFRMQAAPAGGEGVPVTPTGGQAAPGTERMVEPVSTTPGFDGRLTVRFDHVVAGATRKLMATADDVQRVTVRIEGTGVDHTETITRAMLDAGTTSVTFSGLPAVALKVTIQALDAGGTVIGLDVQHATVTAGQTTVVASQVLIAPTVANPRVIVTSGGGGTGGGGTGGTTGSLTASVSLVEGGAVQIPPIEGVYLAGHPGIDVGSLAIGRDGTLWITGGPSWMASDAGASPVERALGGRVYRLAAGGAPTFLDLRDPDKPSYPYAAYRVNTSDPSGKIVVSKSPQLSTESALYSQPGSFPNDLMSVALPNSLVLDASGMLERSVLSAWGAGEVNSTGYLFSSDVDLYLGVRISTGDIGPSRILSGVYFPSKIRFDSVGNLWAVGPRALDFGIHWSELRRIEKLDASGQISLTIDLDGEVASDIALDAHDNLWYSLPSERAVVKVPAGSGSTVKFRSAVRFNQLFIDAFDRVWAYQSILGGHDMFEGVIDETGSGAADDLVTCFNPDGTIQGYYHIGIGADLTELVVTPDGTMWAGTASKGLLKLHVGAPGSP